MDCIALRHTHTTSFRCHPHVPTFEPCPFWRSILDHNIYWPLDLHLKTPELRMYNAPGGWRLPVGCQSPVFPHSDFGSLPNWRQWMGAKLRTCSRRPAKCYVTILCCCGYVTARCREA